MRPNDLLTGLLLGVLSLAGCVASPAAAPPPAAVPNAAARAPSAQADLRCRTDADCTVKNVGTCCGYYPACVNVDSPTDPAAVMAQCKAGGRMSVCGFPQIAGCHCVAGQCTASSAGPDTLRRPIEPTEPLR